MDLHRKKTKSGSKRLVGPNTCSVWPVTEEYAKCMLKIYKPWHGNFDDTLKCKNIITKYNKLLNSPECLKTLEYTSDQALDAFSDSKQRHQPTSENTFPEIDMTSPDIDSRAKSMRWICNFVLCNGE